MKKFLVFTLILLIGTPTSTFSVPTKSQPTLKELGSSTKPPKLAPDLEELLMQDDADEAARLQGKTLAEVRQERLERKAKTRPLHQRKGKPSRNVAW